MTGCDAYPAPVPYEKSLQARDTTPARARTFAGSSGRPRKPGVVTVSHHPTTPQHTQRSLTVTCVATHCKQGNSEPHAMLAKPQQHGNTCDDGGIPTHSALFFVKLNRECVFKFFFSRVRNKKKNTHKFWWVFLGSFACFHSFSSGPINRRRRAAIEAWARRCRRRHALSSSFTWQDTYPHVFCVLPLLSITCREPAPRWTATPLATSRNSTTRSRTR